MVRKAEKIVVEAQTQRPDDEDSSVTEHKNTHDDCVADNDHVQMDTSGEEFPDDVDANKATKGKHNENVNIEKKKMKQQHQQSMVAASIPFMDTFYQLSSEESLNERSIAARDLIHHCFFSEGGVNHKDAAYALSRLMNGLCTGRAASRQGFASCLSSFLRVAHSTGLNGNGKSSIIEIIVNEDSVKFNLNGIIHPAMILRLKLLSTTQFLPHEVNSNGGNKGPKKHGFGGKVKGIEERDNAFGRIFGISAIIRSEILGSTDFPSGAVEAYTSDLIDLYHYKKWMREPSVNAIIELLASIDPESNQNLIAQVANNVIIPKLFRYDDSSETQMQWLHTLTPEMIAVALFLQKPRSINIKYHSPLDIPLVSTESLSALSTALASTSNVLHPRCHIVWNNLWMYLTEEGSTKEHRRLRVRDESLSIADKVMQHVVIDLLLGKAENNTAPTHERRSLALKIVCALSEISPSSYIGQVLRPEVISGVFVNVLCASGGVGKKISKGGGVEHHLKPLTSQALINLINHCCEDDDIDRRLAFAKLFLSAEPRFDSKTKTQTVCSLLMFDDGGDEISKESEIVREALWNQYLTFLEEAVISANSLHLATVNIELMHNLAKRDLNNAPANVARRVVRFFLSGAYFDCSGLFDPSVDGTKRSTKKRKKDKAKTTPTSPPQELSSGLRIKEILSRKGIESIPHDVRAVLSARFYSLLSDATSVINSHNHGSTEGKSFYGKASRPESIYRLLSEIYGIFSLLESSGAKQFPYRCASCDDNNAPENNDPNEESRKYVDHVQKVANKVLAKGSDGCSVLRAKAVFATSCASLMMALNLQLIGCGTPDMSEEEEEDDDDDDDMVEVIQTVHEHISDLADCVSGFIKGIDGKSLEVDGERVNPLAVFAGLAVNILSSPVGGGDFGKTNPTHASASKLTREIIKLAWSGIISATTELIEKNESLKSVLDEDVMNVLIESVCGEKSMGDEDHEEDDDSSVDSSLPENDLGESAVFVNASESGVNNDEVTETGTDDSDEYSDDKDLDDVELDPTKLETLLLEDSDAEIEETELEHHAGADKALARLIKLKQEARKGAQAERERVDLCDRLRCACLLDSLFAPHVLKSGWLPIEAVLGSILSILRAIKVLSKSIQSSSSANTKKSMSEKNALVDRLSALVKIKLSKYRWSNGPNAVELALKASSAVVEEMSRSLNVAHCSCCSVALITAVRCIPKVEASQEVKEIYADLVEDWCSRKTTKIHACVFDDLIRRIPSLAALILIVPLLTATSGARSPFLKCESIKLLSAIYKHDVSRSEEGISDNAIIEMKSVCSKVAAAFDCALGDSSLQKSKHRDEVLISTKHFIHYLKAHEEGILTESDLCSLQSTLKSVEVNCNSAGMKQLCSQVSVTIASLPRKADTNEQKLIVSKQPSKKQRKKGVGSYESKK